MALRELKLPWKCLLGLGGALGIITLAPLPGTGGEAIRFSRPSEDLGITTPDKENQSKKSNRPKSLFDGESPSPGPAVSVPTPSGQNSGISSRRMLEELKQRRDNWLFFMGEDESSSSTDSIFEEEAQQWIGMGRASDPDMEYFFEGSDFGQGDTNNIANRGREEDDKDPLESESGRFAESEGNDRMTWGRFFSQGEQSGTALSQIPSGEFSGQASDPWGPLNAPGEAVSAATSTFGQGSFANRQLGSESGDEQGFETLFGNSGRDMSMFQHEDPIAPMLDSTEQPGSSLFGQSDSNQGGTGSGSQSLTSSSSTGSPFGVGSQSSGTGGLNEGFFGQSSRSSSNPNDGPGSRRSLNSGRGGRSSGFSAPTVLEVPRRGF